jgi:MGT family glycosyltransferase
MTLGRGNAAHNIPDAPNIETHEWLSHTAVLPHAAVLVCHGGMGSILEALYFGRSVVVVPHTPEQVINGRRIVELGLGRVVHSDELTAANLRQVVDDLAGDQAVAQQLAQMRASMIAAGGARRAADVIEGHFAS